MYNFNTHINSQVQHARATSQCNLRVHQAKLQLTNGTHNWNSQEQRICATHRRNTKLSHFQLPLLLCLRRISISFPAIGRASALLAPELCSKTLINGSQTRNLESSKCSQEQGTFLELIGNLGYDLEGKVGSEIC